MLMYTVVLIKPDAVMRGLVGTITQRFEQRGLQLVDMYMCHATSDQIDEHYEDLVDKPYYPDIVKSMTMGPLVAQLWHANIDTIKVVREMVGATDPQDAKAGTIRGDYSIHIGRNICHASSSHDAAVFEMSIWFPAFTRQSLAPTPLTDLVVRPTN